MHKEAYLYACLSPVIYAHPINLTRLPCSWSYPLNGQLIEHRIYCIVLSFSFIFDGFVLCFNSPYRWFNHRNVLQIILNGLTCIICRTFVWLRISIILNIYLFIFPRLFPHFFLEDACMFLFALFTSRAWPLECQMTLNLAPGCPKLTINL